MYTTNLSPDLTVPKLLGYIRGGQVESRFVLTHGKTNWVSAIIMFVYEENGQTFKEYLLKHSGSLDTCDNMTADPGPEIPHLNLLHIIYVTRSD